MSGQETRRNKRFHTDEGDSLAEHAFQDPQKRREDLRGSPTQRSLFGSAGMTSVEESNSSTALEKSRLSIERCDKDDGILEEQVGEEGSLTLLLEQDAGSVRTPGVHREELLQEQQGKEQVHIGVVGANQAMSQFLVQERAKKNIVSKKDVNHYIKEFVRCNIYPKMKFFRRSDTIASKSRVAQLVLDEVSGIEKESVLQRDDWWNRHVRIVRQAIDDRRSANSNAIKEVFMSLLENRLNNDKHVEENGEYEDGFEPKIPELPTMKELLELRLNSNVFELFCDVFLRCVVGKLIWRDRVSHDLVSQIATPSDEALALLILENSWDRWEQIYILDGDFRKATISTKWTSDAHQASPYCGWNIEGRERFNELRKMVINDRSSDYCGPVEENFRQKKQDQTNKKKRKKGSLEEDEVECEDDFDL